MDGEHRATHIMLLLQLLLLLLQYIYISTTNIYILYIIYYYYDCFYYYYSLTILYNKLHRLQGSCISMLDNAQSCVVCCDGAALKRIAGTSLEESNTSSEFPETHPVESNTSSEFPETPPVEGTAKDETPRWGVGITVSFHADSMGKGPAIRSIEDSLNGWNRDSKYTDEKGKRHNIIIMQNDIATIETMAMARAFWEVAKMARYRRDRGLHEIAVVVVTDHIASLRDLEHENCQPINTELSSTRKTYRYAFANSLIWLRNEIVEALRVQTTIRVVYHRRRGFDKKWRPDQLSRSAEDLKCVFVPQKDVHSGVSINFNADQKRLVNEDGMILEQVLRLT